MMPTASLPPRSVAARRASTLESLRRAHAMARDPLAAEWAERGDVEQHAFRDLSVFALAVTAFVFVATGALRAVGLL